MRTPTPFAPSRPGPRGVVAAGAGAALALVLALGPLHAFAQGDDEGDDVADAEIEGEAANDGGEVADVEGEVDEIIEERAAEEDADGEAAGADVGEASYNVEDCRPANDGEVVAEVDDKSLDPCEDMDK